MDDAVVHHRVMDGAVHALRGRRCSMPSAAASFRPSASGLLLATRTISYGQSAFFGGVEQSRHIGACAGDQDGNFGFNQRTFTKSRSPGEDGRGRPQAVANDALLDTSGTAMMVAPIHALHVSTLPETVQPFSPAAMRPIRCTTSPAASSAAVTSATSPHSQRQSPCPHRS